MSSEASTQRPKVMIFVMDAPNVDMALGEVIGHIPSIRDRPNFQALMEWLQSQKQDDEILLAKIFANLSPDRAEKQQAWTEKLAKLGFSTYIKQRRTESSDVDSDMVNMLRGCFRDYTITRVIVASNDGQCFRSILNRLASDGIPVTVLGFTQKSSILTRHRRFRFVPWPSLPGVLPNFQAVPPALKQ